MAWQYNKTVLATFAWYGTQWAWANLDGGTGWKRVKDGAPDGCTNLFIMLNAARANNRQVHVDIDTGDLITTAYLL